MIQSLLSTLLLSCCFLVYSKEVYKDDQTDQFWIENGNAPNQSYDGSNQNDISKNKRYNDTEEIEETFKRLSNCSPCMMRDDTKALRIEAIKTQILSKLKLKTAPNITTRPLPKVPLFYQIKDHSSIMSGDSPGGQEHFVKEEVDDYHASTEKVMLFSSDVPKHFPISDELRPHILYFKLTPKMKLDLLAKANLWIYTRPSKQETTVMLNISRIYSTISNNAQKLNLTNSRIMKLDLIKRNGFWSYYDIRKIVSHWYRHPKENYGILVQAMTHDGKNLVVNKLQEGEEAMKPFLELRVTDSSEKRIKRMVSLDCQEDSQQPLCCRYPLVVDFEEFGWDWIIAPKRYEANYCSGDCPFLFLNSYSHTHLVGLQQSNPQGSSSPCCAPTKMSAISMLHFDDSQNIIYSKLPGMVVDRCGCI